MARSKKTSKDPTGTDFDPSLWSHACFVVGGFVLAWAFANLVEDVWAFTWSQWPQSVGRPSANLSNVAGIVLAIIVTGWAWRKEQYFKFMNEVATEVSQVVWPTRAETRAATWVVIVITLICSGLLSAMDFFWSTVTDALYGL